MNLWGHLVPSWVLQSGTRLGSVSMGGAADKEATQGFHPDPKEIRGGYGSGGRRGDQTNGAAPKQAA